MELLIVSDSHGRTDFLRCAIQSHPHARYVLFCGDGVRDVLQVASDFPDRIFYTVRGNCDFFVSEHDAPEEKLLVLENRRILMMHGHTCGVKGGLGAAVLQAEKQQADVLLYGHTHQPQESMISCRNGLYLCTLNPGSIAEGSYGLLEIKGNGILSSHGRIT